MEDPISITVNIKPELLKNLKFEAVYNGISYSDALSSYLIDLASVFKKGETKIFWEKYIKDRMPIKRGRPSEDFILAHGPILKKKASFYIDKKLRRKVGTCIRHLGISLSDFVELALTTDVSSIK